MSVSGTTGITVTSSWRIFSWDGSSWNTVDNGSAYTNGTKLAIAYYPEGLVPVETPEYRSSWTMVEKDAENSAVTDAELGTGQSKVEWDYSPAQTGVYSSVLYAQGHAFVKYGYIDKGFVSVVSYDVKTGDVDWTFKYTSHTNNETSTGLIAGDSIYVQSSNGQIYRFPWAEGPGDDYCNVTTFDGEPWGSEKAIPSVTKEDILGSAWGSGPTSLVFDSGCIFTKDSNGMVYCFDTDLRLVWSYQTNGNTYFSAPTVHGDYVAVGMYDGVMYILDKVTGSPVVTETVFQTEYASKISGCVNVPTFVESKGNTYIFVTFNDGRGMSAKTYGFAVYQLNGNTLKEIRKDTETLGTVSTYLTKAASFDGVYINAGIGTCTLDVNGKVTVINDIITLDPSHATATLVNGKYLFVSSYAKNTLYQIDVDGTTVGTVPTPVRQYCMAPVTVVDGYIICGNDAGVYCFSGAFDPYVPPSYDEDTPLWMTILMAVAAIVVILAALWCILRFGMKWEKPFEHLKDSFYTFLYGENYTHSRRSRHRLWLVMLVGILITIMVAILSLCVGSETTLSIPDALSATFSSIQKGGRHLTYEEMLIYNARLPRTVAALAVGIGLSVAGCVYQAVIKNPLVEPYIMGVSSGAGTLAVAVISYDFTFFGLMDSHDPYLTALAAIIGGLLAFGLTMLMAVKTGGKSTNYVLAGIVIGLVFSAMQSLLMIHAGKDVASSLSWLYGSFTSITWQKVWIVLIPVLALSMAPIIWAKELNLVLLGEDQAKQMGLDAAKFDRYMLILVSVMTAFCVAFCGVIGFVGLVIPHLCRLILGGDHRLILPASMAFGGFLMILADLLSRVLLTGYELPVGAITTCIGVPVFAYLLIRRGKSYDM
ncbi:MAG: iron chelate uptake ABC transporter family permease subunit [archaeon]|nr:iron chelate uptake ABC transporter family permease subunit [archaeon]